MALKYGFELIKEQDIPEIRTHATLFRHVQSGAELLSLKNDDENKVFGAVFRTPPTNSTGVAHIMEHGVLCGSRKYPVREPFVELKKGSLSTFLNAFTFPDKTCYPVASQNVQDFYNLIDVYMDAVFYPLIPPEVLQQEGWHYELNSVDEPLTYKGVVYNEMKGAYSSPDDILSRAVHQSIFPDNTYSFDSGGDPKHIPDLTYEEYKDFHQRYYHPSNARLFFYGDDDPEERLRRMDEYLKDFQLSPVDSNVALQKHLDEPRAITVPYVVGDEPGGDKAMLTVNWLLPETQDPLAALSMTMLGYILIGTPASPLRKALIDSGLGEDLAGDGLSADLRQMYFSTGLKGVAQENTIKVEELIHQTLRQLVEQGIEPDMVDAAVNTIEFRLRENNTGSFPRGISLMLRALRSWLYGGDPFAPLAFETPLNTIKQRLTSGEHYFEDLIRQHMLDNHHRTTLTLQPDPELRAKQEAEEKECMDKVRQALGIGGLTVVMEDTIKLKKRQEAPDPPEALATIPSLSLSDIDKSIRTIPLAESKRQDVYLLYHDLFTNGILYMDVGMNLHTLPQELLPYVPLFGRSLLEMGTEKENFVKLSQRIGRTTGGIRPTAFTSLKRNSPQSAAWQFLRGKATMSQVDDLLAILTDVLLSVKLDNQERFKQMALEEKAGLESALAPAGHQLAHTRLNAMFNEAGWASEQMGGISHLFFLRKLVEDIDKNWPGVLEKLEQIRRNLINRSAMLVNVTLDQESFDKIGSRLEGFLSALPNAPVTEAPWKTGSLPGYEGLTIPAQVNFVGKGADLYQLGYQLSGSQEVIENYLGATWLWEKVRVQGGAYGGFSTFDLHSGVFTYLSYRDPNLLKTLENYDKTGEFLRNLDLSQEELTKAIIGAIGELDRYQLPDAKGFTSMLRCLLGDTDDLRQQYRDQVLSTTQKDFRAFGEVLDRLVEAGKVVVIGSSQAIEAVNASRPGWLEVKKVL